MGRPPSNGGPSFRFNQAEIAEMEAILQAHRTAMPERQVLVSLAEKFSNSEERLGKIEVQMKQVWNWFQNRRYAIRAKAAKSPGKLSMTQTARDEVKGVPLATQPHAASSATVRSLPQAAQHPTVPSASVRTFPQAPQHPPAFSVQTAGRVADNSQMEYEAKSARDGAWYDVSTFLSHRSLETGDPEVLVRFAGFGAEEDEWVNVRKNVRQRSLPCESSECVAVLPADLILCFQEGKEQALYFDAHVLDAQRRRHDVRGCRCRFLVRYDHDQSEEIVALRKICRRPETDYRLQQLHAVNEAISANQNKNGANNNIHTVSTLRVYPPAEVQPKQQKVDSMVPPSPAEAPQKRQRLDSTVPPEGSQRQFKVEPAVLADVPRNQQGVQPAVAALGHKVEPAPPAQPLVEVQRAEPVVHSPSDLGSLEPKKVEPVVPLLSGQESGEPQNVVPVGPTFSDEVPRDTQKVQPVMPDPSTEVLVEPHKVESNLPSSSEAKQELQTVETNVVLPLPKESEEHNKAEPCPSGEVPEVGPTNPPPADAPVGSNEGDPMVPEPEKEPVVSGSSVEVPVELHEVQPHVPDQPHTSTLEAKTNEPMLLVSTDEPNVVEMAIETKTEEPVVPVSTNGPIMVEAVETKTEGPVVPVSTDGPNMVEAIETKTKEPVVPVSTDGPNMVEAMETKTKEPLVPVSTDGPNMVEATESKTKEPVVPVSTDGSNVVEAKTEEPVVPVHSNDMNVVEEAIQAKSEEPVVHASTHDHAVVQEAKTEEPAVLTNDPNVIEAEVEQPKVSEIMDCNEDRQANVAETTSNSTVENSDLAPEDAAVAMEEG